MLFVTCILCLIYPESKVHGANMGPTCVLSAPNGPHVGPMNLAIRVCTVKAWQRYQCSIPLLPTFVHGKEPEKMSFLCCLHKKTMRCNYPDMDYIDWWYVKTRHTLWFWGFYISHVWFVMMREISNHTDIIKRFVNEYIHSYIYIYIFIHNIWTEVSVIWQFKQELSMAMFISQSGAQPKSVTQKYLLRS